MNKMPKKVINDYVFYKIVCLDNSVELCYVGSTADFNKRRSTHKSDCYNQDKANYNSKIYKTIRENGGWDNFKMIEIGKKEQLTKRQAEQVEEEYRVELKANMNSQRCYTTEEQKEEADKEYQQNYRGENKDKIREQQQNYYEANKDKILERNQKYRDENRDKINERNQKYREANKDKIKEQIQNYQEENKDKILEYQQNYRQENKDKILEYQQNYRQENKDKINQKVKCECGLLVCKASLSTHKKRPKHIKLMNQIKTGNKN